MFDEEVTSTNQDYCRKQKCSLEPEKGNIYVAITLFYGIINFNKLELYYKNGLLTHFTSIIIPKKHAIKCLSSSHNYWNVF
jgi:hypothetical protein